MCVNMVPNSNSIFFSSGSESWWHVKNELRSISRVALWLRVIVADYVWYLSLHPVWQNFPCCIEFNRSVP
jgi:hypothetical protein